MIKHSEKWDLRFLAMAWHASSWSKDPSTKVGAVIAGPRNEIISHGYNGFPRGVLDTADRLDNRDIKYKLTVHAEINALNFSGRTDHAGCSIYTWPLAPCSRCTTDLIQRGISRVVTIVDDLNNPRWAEDVALGKEMQTEVGIDVQYYQASIVFESMIREFSGLSRLPIGFPLK